jgi:hypothetical protein
MAAKSIAAIDVATIFPTAIRVTSFHIVAMSLGTIVDAVAVAAIGMPGEGATMCPAEDASSARASAARVGRIKRAPHDQNGHTGHGRHGPTIELHPASPCTLRIQGV